MFKHYAAIAIFALSDITFAVAFGEKAPNSVLARLA
jgi:hypothetical protein